MKPVIAITVGDPAGIGPEVVAQSLGSAARVGRPVVFGHWPSLRRAVDRAGCAAVIDLGEPADVPAPGRIAVVHCGPSGDAIEDPGPASAAAQFAALEMAVTTVLDGKCTALINGPVNKAAVASVNPGFLGHTEYLAQRCGLERTAVTMVFSCDELAVGLVATHVPMKDVPRSLTRDRYERTVRHLVALLEAQGRVRPLRIGVAALNPHGGEDGLLGSEELTVIGPVCETLAREPDIELVGPVPADTLFRDAFAGRYHGVVAAYHDQALIPLKLAGPGTATNVTMGLPFVRTAPDHGVGYDIAGRALADPSAMGRAIGLAVELCGQRIEGGKWPGK